MELMYVSCHSSVQNSFAINECTQCVSIASDEPLPHKLANYWVTFLRGGE